MDQSRFKSSLNCFTTSQMKTKNCLSNPQLNLILVLPIPDISLSVEFIFYGSARLLYKKYYDSHMV